MMVMGVTELGCIIERAEVRVLSKWSRSSYFYFLICWWMCTHLLPLKCSIMLYWNFETQIQWLPNRCYILCCHYMVQLGFTCLQPGLTLHLVFTLQPMHTQASTCTSVPHVVKTSDWLQNWITSAAIRPYLSLGLPPTLTWWWLTALDSIETRIPRI